MKNPDTLRDEPQSTGTFPEAEARSIAARGVPSHTAFKMGFERGRESVAGEMALIKQTLRLSDQSNDDLEKKLAATGRSLIISREASSIIEEKLMEARKRIAELEAQIK